MGRCHQTTGRLRFIFPVLLLAYLPPAGAQRADENVLTSAQDAFGTTVGEESIGLYSANQARGFSPRQAGNIRIEGLFYQGPSIFGALSRRLVGRTVLRVGISAQSSPFPSPTGIADHSLRVPGNDYVLSAVARLGPYESTTGELDAQIPIIDDRLSLGIGLSGGRSISNQGTSSYSWSGALIGRWRIGESVEIIPFWGRTQIYDSELSPFIFMAGPFPPPKYKRGTYFGEDWADFNRTDSSFGVIARADWSNWQLRLGAFRALGDFAEGAQHQYTNTRPDGSAIRRTLVFFAPPFPEKTNSGEFRLSRPVIEGPRRHTFHVNTRGRISARNVVRLVVVDISPATLGIPTPLLKPELTPIEGGIEKIRQGSLGVSYEGQWRDVGEFSAGLQRVFYKRTSENPDVKSVQNSWLYNATLTAYISDRLALYGSYTRGFEGSRTAPPSAENVGEGVGANITQQVDAGFRYTFSPSLKLIAGLFEVKKPYFALNSAFFYKRLGSTRHRGAEVSLTGELIDGLTVVTGLVLLKARLSGELVDQGTIGKIPTDSVPLKATVNVQYGPDSWRGFSFDARMAHDASYIANVQNTFKSPAITLFDLGARYRFTISDLPSSLRFQVTNVFNTYKWRFHNSNQFRVNPTPQRRFTLQLAVDF